MYTIQCTVSFYAQKKNIQNTKKYFCLKIMNKKKTIKHFYYNIQNYPTNTCK